MASAVAGLDGFVSIERRGTALVWLLVVIIGLSVIAVGSDLAEANLLGRIAGGGGWTEAEVDSSDTRQAMLGVLQLLFFIATGLVWLNWFSQAYRNLPALGARDLRFTPGWAVGAWFVPFLNMVRPKQMTDDVWRASDPRAPAVHSGPWKGQRVSPLLHWWWALFLISGIVGQLLVRGGFQDTSTMAGIQSLNTLTTFSDLLDIPLAILAILVVRQIGDRQEERARVLSTMTARA